MEKVLKAQGGAVKTAKILLIFRRPGAGAGSLLICVKPLFFK